MPRKSVMIPFDPAAFRETVKNRGEALSDLEPVIRVSRQALNGWLTTAKIPPRQLYSIAEKFQWSREELAAVLGKKDEETLVFRTHRHVLPNDAAKDTALRLAKDFFLLDSLAGDYPKSQFALRVDRNSSATVVAEALLKYLDLKRGQFSVEELIQALTRLNLSVVFVDFGVQFELIEDKSAKAMKAFTFKCGEKYLIFIDSRIKIEDVMWTIFHELTHIVRGDFDSDSSEGKAPEYKENEKFCNEVANEVLTPKDFFQARHDYFERMLDCSFKFLPSRIEHLATELGASFVGVLLSLKSEGLLTPQKENYLWGVHNRRKETELTVKDLVEPSGAATREDLLGLWNKTLNTEEIKKFIRLHVLVRQGLIEGKLSVARASELLGIDAGEMEELANHWVAEVSDAVAD